MCCSPHCFAVQAATHYHTRAWQTLIYEIECFILLLYEGKFEPEQEILVSSKACTGVRSQPRVFAASIHKGSR